jgi:hypothetical protein
VERVTLEKKGVYDVALLQKVASLKNILDHTPEKQIRDQQITFFSFPFSQENGIQYHSLVTLFFKTCFQLQLIIPGFTNFSDVHSYTNMFMYENAHLKQVSYTNGINSFNWQSV